MTIADQLYEQGFGMIRGETPMFYCDSCLQVFYFLEYVALDAARIHRETCSDATYL